MLHLSGKNSPFSAFYEEGGRGRFGLCHIPFVLCQMLKISKKERVNKIIADGNCNAFRASSADRDNTALGKHHVPNAVHDAQPLDAGCMDGTRVQLLDSMKNLVISRRGAHIVWIAGMAGTGKTSIALTLCRTLAKESTVLLGGTFFCSRSAGAVDRTDVHRIIPTFATVLARRVPSYADALAKELNNDPDVAHKTIRVQIEHLLIRPFEGMESLDRQIVFVIDALDEFSSQERLVELINMLADFDCPIPVKFLFTSRPEMHIRRTSIADTSFSSIIYLHTIDPAHVAGDIRLYIQKTLESRLPLSKWYTDDDLDDLSTLSGGLFIFASTAIRYILGRNDVPGRLERLRTVKRQTSVSTIVTAPLDKMYSLVLTQASDLGTIEPTELEETRRIIAIILLARAPLTIKALAELVGMSPLRLRGALEGLHAVILVPEDDEENELRILHASFSDFIFTRAPEHVRIHKEFGHKELARGCLQRMAADDLCFNISRSVTSYTANPNCIPGWIATSLIYACLQWAHHVELSLVRSLFDEQIDSVFRRKFLFWLEVLSVVGQIGPASGLLCIAASTVSSGPGELGRPLTCMQVTTENVFLFLRDATSFVTSSHEAIECSAAHIYLSALPFTPRTSLIRQRFSVLFTGLPSIETFGIDNHGGRCVMVLAGYDQSVTSIAYSPSGKVIASGSDNIVQLRDTRSGAELFTPLTSSDGEVHSIAFTSDGCRLIGGTRTGYVLVWDVQTGCLQLPPLRRSAKGIRAVAVSPDGRTIASCSEDCTIDLWSSETGQSLSHLLSGHNRGWAVAFSPDKKTLAFGALDNTVRLWDYNQGYSMDEPLRGHRSSVLSVAFSQDGFLLASGSEDGGVRVWDPRTGYQIRNYSGHRGWVQSMAFSPSGTTLASGSYDCTVRIWDLHDDNDGRSTSSLVLRGHSSRVNSVCFSSDGLNVASGSDDRTIRVWNVGGRHSAVLPLDGHSDWVDAVAVSGDGRLIVSASRDGTTRVWDAQTCEQMYPPLLGHAGPVHSVAFSSDSRWIATGSADTTIRLWNAQNGQPTASDLRGHNDTVVSVAFSPDGLCLASGSYDHTVRIWNIAAVGPVQILQIMCSHWVLSMAYSHDGKLIAVGNYRGDTQIFDAATGQQIRLFKGSDIHSVESLAFSPDSTRIVVPAATDIAGFDIQAGNQISISQGHTGQVHAVTYSPDGRFVASGACDLTVRLWKEETAEALEPVLHGHVDIISSVFFSPDGRVIVSGSRDTTIRLWDLEKARALSVHPERNALSTLAFAQYKGGWLISSTGEHLLWVPAEYRGRLEIGGHSQIIATHRVVVTADDGVLHQGEQWTRCWRADGSSSS